jgi:hypothetical protein
LIRIRYADLPAGLHVRVEAKGRSTIIYLLPGLTHTERRAALQRARSNAGLGHGPRLPAASVAAAVVRDRVGITARNGAAAFRAHPLLLVPLVVVAASATLAYVMLSAVTITFPRATPGGPARSVASGPTGPPGPGPSARFGSGPPAPGGAPGTRDRRRAGASKSPRAGSSASPRPSGTGSSSPPPGSSGSPAPGPSGSAPSGSAPPGSAPPDPAPSSGPPSPSPTPSPSPSTCLNLGPIGLCLK